MVAAMENVHLEPVIIEDLVKYGEDLGFERGAAQERVRVYDNLLADRLGRSLTPREHDTLVRRIAAVTTKRLHEVMFSASPAALEAWLADPSTT